MGFDRPEIVAGALVPGNDRSAAPDGPLAAWLAGLRADVGVFRLSARAIRALRRSPAILQPAALTALWQLPPFLAHMAAEGGGDPLFFLSHRQFLFRDRSASWRLTAAASHYHHEARQFDSAYCDQVYVGGGLQLWHRRVDGIDYAVLLMRGSDVVYEGGLSLVFTANGARICVLSLSMLPTALLEAGPALPTSPVYVVTRKQLTQERDYQAAFNAAFHRSTPAHLCFGALAGMAQAQGHAHIFGIAPEWHPSYTADLAPQFDRAYREFWESLSGRRAGPMGFAIDLPMHMTPLEDLPAARRKRAIARREVIDDVRRSAGAALAPHLRGPAG